MIASLKKFLMSLMLLILYLVFHLLSFAIVTSACIGLALLFVFIIETWFGSLTGNPVEVPQYVAVGLTMFLLFDAVKINIALAEVCTRIRNGVLRLKKKFSFMLQFVPQLLRLILIAVAIFQLFHQFQITHLPTRHSIKTDRTMPRNAKHPRSEMSRSTPPELEPSLEDYRSNVTIFVFSLATLVFISAKEVQTDLVKIFKDLPGDDVDFYIMTFCLLLGQICATVGYSIPVLNVLILVEIFECSRTIMFFTVTISGIVVGIAAGYFESRSPFPIEPDQGPHFSFENQVRARMILLQFGLFPLVPYFFFVPGKNQEFDSNDTTFIQFTISVAICILHATKILCVTYRLDESRRRRNARRIRKLRLRLFHLFGRSGGIAVAPAPELGPPTDLSFEAAAAATFQLLDLRLSDVELPVTPRRPQQICDNNNNNGQTLSGVNSNSSSNITSEESNQTSLTSSHSIALPETHGPHLTVSSTSTSIS